MSLFQRIRDNVSKGYREAADRDTPSLAELQGLRKRTVDASDESTATRSVEEQTELRRDLSEIDRMIARANKLADKKASQALAG